jgi:hypothetical protein
MNQHDHCLCVRKGSLTGSTFGVSQPKPNREVPLPDKSRLDSHVSSKRKPETDLHCIVPTMRKTLLFLYCTTCLIAPLRSQDGEAVVKKESVSIHTVERGSMSLFASASGSLTSLLGTAVLTFESTQGRCESGRSARLVVGEAPKAYAGRVVKRLEHRSGIEQCEVEFVDALPEGAAVGSRIGALIEVGAMKNVVFFGRPAGSVANSTATVFVLEEKTSFARRVVVRYGVRSGPLIQVLDGLAPGDKVIVTDMSKWAKAPRIRIE